MRTKEKKYVDWIGREDDFQKACARYLDHLQVLWCHPPNGSYKTKAQAGIFKAIGLKPGVPDIMIFEPRNEFNGLAIELKVRGNSTSAYQDEWLMKLQEKGWKTEICYGLDQFINIIDEYFKSNK